MYGLRDEVSSFNKNRMGGYRARVRSFLDRRKEGYAGVRQKLKGVAGFMPEVYNRVTALGGTKTPAPGRGFTPGERMREIAGNVGLPSPPRESTVKGIANALQTGGKSFLKSGGSPLLAAGATAYELAQKLKGIRGPAPETFAATMPATMPEQAIEPDLRARAEKAAGGGEFKPDFSKPNWWKDERLGDRRPTRVILGTESHWQSPITGGSYATPKEAYEGIGVDVRALEASRAHELELEKTKGRYGLLEQTAKPFKRYEELGSSPMGEPSILDTLTGGVSAPGMPGAAQGGIPQEAIDSLNSVSPEIAQAQLADMPPEQRKAILPQLDPGQAEKILKIWRSLL